jgi:hypothetical protein
MGFGWGIRGYQANRGSVCRTRQDKIGLVDVEIKLG